MIFFIKTKTLKCKNNLNNRTSKKNTTKKSKLAKKMQKSS